MESVRNEDTSGRGGMQKGSEGDEKKNDRKDVILYRTGGGCESSGRGKIVWSCDMMGRDREV